MERKTEKKEKQKEQGNGRKKKEIKKGRIKT